MERKPHVVEMQAFLQFNKNILDQAQNRKCTTSNPYVATYVVTYTLLQLMLYTDIFKIQKLLGFRQAPCYLAQA